MRSREQIVVLAISMVMMSTMFTVVLLQPLPATVIVAFGNSEAERTAISTLTQSIDNEIVVQYGSFEYNMARMRCIESMVFVGHGVEDGIQCSGGLVSDVELARDIRSTVASSVYMLACDSGGLADQEGLDRVIAFRGFVDAELGALAVATRISLSRGSVSEAEDTFDLLIDGLVNKLFGHVPYMPLYMDEGSAPPPGPYLSTSEFYNFLALLIVGGIAGMICASAVFAMGQHFARAAAESVSFIGLSWRELIKAFLTVVTVNTATNLVNSMLGGFWNFALALAASVHNAVNIAISRMTSAEWAIFIGLTALEIIIVILSGGYGYYVRLAAALTVAVINAVVIGIVDAQDSNGTPCTSVLEAISQLYG